MGCDIHAQAERLIEGKWEVIDDLPIFEFRCYGLFGFLANVRNYSAVPPMSLPRGLPADTSADDDDRYLGDHSQSWLTLEELFAFDYDETFEDRRTFAQTGPNSFSGGMTADAGQGTMVTFRQFLPKEFFDDINAARRHGAHRIVFGFDS